jgi:uncharacterized protein YjbI with pentapeptide repeats
MLRRLGAKLEQLAAERPVLLAFMVLVTAAVIIIPASLPFYLSDTLEFTENIMAEAHGTLFDLLVIGWFLLWLNKRAETRVANNRYREEIEDFLGWKSPEATHRIAGNIRRLNRGGVKARLRLTHAYLKGANLANVSLQESDLWGADLEGAMLSGANLRGCNMAGANLENAEMEHVVLIESDLRGANLKEADLERATLSKADIRGAQLHGADLQYATLIAADLERAELVEANLREANLQSAILTRANLTGANLSGANLRGADLRNAILNNVDLERANLTDAKLGEGGDLTKLLANVRSLEGAKFAPSVSQSLSLAANVNGNGAHKEVEADGRSAS